MAPNPSSGVLRRKPPQLMSVRSPVLVGVHWTVGAQGLAPLRD
ncbi:MAG: hypothetical protein ACFKPT_26700 [Gloeotrichia echinulata GP01]